MAAGIAKSWLVEPPYEILPGHQQKETQLADRHTKLSPNSPGTLEKGATRNQKNYTCLKMASSAFLTKSGCRHRYQNTINVTS
jgi:hypothetical protein